MEPNRITSQATKVFAALSDDELVERVKHLAECERRASAALIRSLVEFDARRLYLREGCSSLFTYCTQVLHLSEGSAYNRIETARAARRYPKVLEALERGDVTLTAIRLLAPHLTPANHGEILAGARHKSKQEIQELISSLNPRPAAATIIRRVTPQPVDSTPALALAQERAPSLERTAAINPPSVQDVAAPHVPPLRAAVVTPLAPERYKLQVTLTRETHEKLRRAQALARHTVPNGDVGSILDRALTLLIDELERRRFARVASPRSSPEGTTAGRHIPAPVRRAVWQRDEGRCAFVGAAGRCRETAFLEFHHVEPYAAGGEATTDNIQLRCHAHNQYEARLFFGDALVRDRQERILEHDSSDRVPDELLLESHASRCGHRCAPTRERRNRDP
jgi:hypothetical protein